MPSEMTPTSVDDEEIELPHETAPENIPVNLTGFADVAEAQDFGHLIARTTRAISRFIDLERLDGITVAYDYDAALAELDRGYEVTRPLTRTTGDQLAGVAMAPAVRRDGIVKGHLVFHAPFIRALAHTEGDTEMQRALYLLAHECGHVADLKTRDLAFPGTILQWRPDNWDDAVLLVGATAAWEEYAACRISAVFDPTVVHAYGETTCSVLPVARSTAMEQVIAYRLHGDINRLMETAGRALCEPMRMLGYLLGSLDGVNQSLESVPAARDSILANGYQELAECLSPEFRTLWESRGEWAPDAFRGLMDVARSLLASGGIFLSPGNVDVPLTPDTIPLG